MFLVSLEKLTCFSNFYEEAKGVACHLSLTVNTVSNDAQYFKHQIRNRDTSNASWVMQW